MSRSRSNSTAADVAKEELATNKGGGSGGGPGGGSARGAAKVAQQVTAIEVTLPTEVQSLEAFLVHLIDHASFPSYLGQANRACIQAIRLAILSKQPGILGMMINPEDMQFVVNEIAHLAELYRRDVACMGPVDDMPVRYGVEPALHFLQQHMAQFIRALPLRASTFGGSPRVYTLQEFALRDEKDKSAAAITALAKAVKKLQGKKPADAAKEKARIDKLVREFTPHFYGQPHLGKAYARVVWALNHKSANIRAMEAIDSLTGYLNYMRQHQMRYKELGQLNSLKNELDAARRVCKDPAQFNGDAADIPVSVRPTLALFADQVWVVNEDKDACRQIMEIDGASHVLPPVLVADASTDSPNIGALVLNLAATVLDRARQVGDVGLGGQPLMQWLGVSQVGYLAIYHILRHYKLHTFDVTPANRTKIIARLQLEVDKFRRHVVASHKHCGQVMQYGLPDAIRFLQKEKIIPYLLEEFIEGARQGLLVSPAVRRVTEVEVVDVPTCTGLWNYLRSHTNAEQGRLTDQARTDLFDGASHRSLAIAAVYYVFGGRESRVLEFKGKPVAEVMQILYQRSGSGGATDHTLELMKTAEWQAYIAEAPALSMCRGDSLPRHTRQALDAEMQLYEKPDRVADETSRARYRQQADMLRGSLAWRAVLYRHVDNLQHNVDGSSLCLVDIGVMIGALNTHIRKLNHQILDGQLDATVHATETDRSGKRGFDVCSQMYKQLHALYLPMGRLQQQVVNVMNEAARCVEDSDRFDPAQWVHLSIQVMHAAYHLAVIAEQMVMICDLLNQQDFQTSWAQEFRKMKDDLAQQATDLIAAIEKFCPQIIALSKRHCLQAVMQLPDVNATLIMYRDAAAGGAAGDAQSGRARIQQRLLQWFGPLFEAISKSSLDWNQQGSAGLDLPEPTPASAAKAAVTATLSARLGATPTRAADDTPVGRQRSISDPGQSSVKPPVPPRASRRQCCGDIQQALKF